jgi:hypothetical protein
VARQTNGTDQSLQSASAIDLTSYAKIALSFWLWWDAFANNNKLALELSADVGANAGAFQVAPNRTSSADFGVAAFGNVGFNLAGLTRPSGAAWHHYVANLDFTKPSHEVDTIYIDGVSQSLTWSLDENNTGSFGNYVLNVMSRNNAVDFGAGRIAEVAIYADFLLGQTQVDSLYNGGTGIDARTVQGANLHNYWQLCGTDSPEPALVGGVDMTVNGATQVAHPITGAGICGSGGAVVPPIFARVVQSGLRW